jgi:FkbM family methyltransferase
MKIKKLYEETGMFIDWSQLKRLPFVDTLIDIGVGPKGTIDLYENFPSSKLILIDPLEEARLFFENELKRSESEFYQIALGEEDGGDVFLEVQDNLACTSLLKVTSINYEDNVIAKRKVRMERLDSLLGGRDNLGSIGIKIDVEGYELNVLRGSINTLKKTKFVLAEVRHNYQSFEGVYGLKDFVDFMDQNGFVLSIIFTAKPFIADLCFEPRKNAV